MAFVFFADFSHAVVFKTPLLDSWLPLAEKNAFPT